MYVIAYRVNGHYFFAKLLLVCKKSIPTFKIYYFKPSYYKNALYSIYEIIQIAPAVLLIQLQLGTIYRSLHNRLDYAYYCVEAPFRNPIYHNQNDFLFKSVLRIITNSRFSLSLSLSP